MSRRRLPIGIQTFREIREGDHYLMPAQGLTLQDAVRQEFGYEI